MEASEGRATQEGAAIEEIAEEQNRTLPTLANIFHRGILRLVRMHISLSDEQNWKASWPKTFDIGHKIVVHCGSLEITDLLEETNLSYFKYGKSTAALDTKRISRRNGVCLDRAKWYRFLQQFWHISLPWFIHVKGLRISYMCRYAMYSICSTKKSNVFTYEGLLHLYKYRDFFTSILIVPRYSVTYFKVNRVYVSRLVPFLCTLDHSLLTVFWFPVLLL